MKLIHINTTKYRHDQLMDMSEMRYYMKEQIDDNDIDNHDVKTPIRNIARNLIEINRRKLKTPKV